MEQQPETEIAVTPPANEFAALGWRVRLAHVKGYEKREGVVVRTEFLPESRTRTLIVRLPPTDAIRYSEQVVVTMGNVAFLAPPTPPQEQVQ